MTAESRPLAARILAPGRIHYGWAMAAVTLLVLVMSAGFRSAAGVLIVPLEDEFGWSAATVSSAVSINLIMFGLGAPFAAALHDRFGVRRVTVTALLVVAAASAATTLISEPWQLRVLWGLVIGTATGAVSIPLAAIVGNRWFVRRRGLVTGIMTSANATGQLVFLPVLATIVTTAGWRWASATVAVVALLVVVPLAALLMRDHPADVGLPPYGAEEIEPPKAPAAGPVRTALGALREGSRSGTFWLLTGSFFVCGASTNGLVGTHLIPAAHDHGISEVTAASYLAAIGVFDIVGTTFSGWLTDRHDPRLLLFWYYGLRGLSLLCAALGAGIAEPRSARVHRLLRPGLGRDRPADGGADRRCLRARAGGHLLRVDLRRPPVRGGVRGVRSRRDPHRRRKLPLGVSDLGRDVHGRIAGRHADPHARRPARARDLKIGAWHRFSTERRR